MQTKATDKDLLLKKLPANFEQILSPSGQRKKKIKIHICNNHLLKCLVY